MNYNLKDLKIAQEELEAAKDQLRDICESFRDYFDEMMEMCDNLDLDIIDISTLSGK